MSDAHTKATVAGLYDRVAREYDQVGPPLHQTFGRALVEALEIGADARVLDIATGRGAALLTAAEAMRANGLGLGLGVDLAANMLREARAAARGLGRDRVRLAQMDAEQLGLASERFDYALCAFAIFLLPAPAAALAEWRRVLRPGGWVGVAVSGPEDERWQWYNRLVVAYHERYGFPLSAAVARLRQPAEIGAALTQAGFVNVAIEQRRFEFVWTDEDVWWENKWTHGTRYMLEHMPPEVLAQFRAEALAQLPPLRTAEGLPQAYDLFCVRGQRPL